MGKLSEDARVRKTKRKHGVDCFRRWGSERSGGGSPILRAWREGRVTIHNRRVRKPKNKSKKKG